MPSVIIPAHNEEYLIGDCLTAILADEIADLEVIVVPNACSDRTAEIARSFGARVRVVETDTPGKTNALNLGESSEAAFPRAFIDGDIVLRPGALAATFRALQGRVQIASPPPEFDLAGCDLGVRLFYRSLEASSYFGRGAPNGSGVFAVTEAGRSRWGEFPAVIADDGFVELQFEAAEAMTAHGPTAIVRAPRTFGALIDIKARARLGRIELRERFPELMRPKGSSIAGTFARLFAKPRLWPTIPVYTAVRLIERRRAARQQRHSGFSGWSRDDTTRGQAGNNQTGTASS